MSWPRTAMSEGPPAAVRIAGWSLEELMRSGDLLGTGPIGDLERRLAALYERKHALCVSSATQGLLALACALEIFDGEVVLPPYSWGGSAAPFVWAGADLVLADVEPATMTIDPAMVERRVTNETQFPLNLRITEFGFRAASARRAAGEPAGVTDAEFESFVTTLVDEGLPANLASDPTVRNYLRWRSRISVAQRMSDVGGEADVIAERDPVLAEAIRLLTTNDSQAELFSAINATTSRSRSVS